MTGSRGQTVVLVLSLAALATASVHFFVHWVLFTDTVIRRFLFGA